MQLFLLLILLLHAAMVTAMAGCHSDRDKDHRPRENCTAAGYSDIPVGLELTTKVLLFPGNLFSSLSWTSFQIFTDIYEIDLTGNKVPEVTPSVAPILPSLSVLRLGANCLTSLSDGSFSACPALTELYLHSNAIDSLSDHTFSGLSKLEILDLSSNHITVLPELMLHPLQAIKTLFLESNQIKVMPDNWFSKKKEVPYLYLSANPWACSCSLDYLRRYLDNYEANIYVRDGLIISADVESVVCDSPQQHKGKPVIELEESDLCSLATESIPPGDFYQPVSTACPYETTTPVTTIAFISSSPPPPPPPLPPTTPVTTSPALATTSTATPAVTQLVVTWSWYQTFTSFIEWSVSSGSKVTVEESFTRSNTLDTHLPAVRLSTQSPANMTTATPTKPSTTKSVPSTVTSTTQKPQVVTAAFAIEATPRPSPVIDKVVGGQGRGRISTARAAAVFCCWLFAGCLLLCLASATGTLVTLVMLVIWYRRVYKPLSMALARTRGASQGVRLLACRRGEEKEVAAGGVKPLYRSVLYVHREGGEVIEKEEEEGGGGKERLLVNLELTGGGGGMTGEDEGRREERGVYRKTLYRLLSKEEEIEGWRGVEEECRVSREDGGRSGGGGASRKRYSVILREERDEAGGGREELDWVVGGWEVKQGEGARGEEPRSSWGEWLAHYLPSMPWGVSTPPEGEAAQ
uniref:platelet glycoprotein Ib alpha chain-like n=1 Tax=Monopterus albus TaxID=43700 RepID=UPI0009B3A3EE|nr:platelet glycoprotein Ib alpha chain-like [Monopterus albus]XP_020477820.1 platelet glycoprotein Ib alpha chain-like [Monopterus albus]XP_020477821.1 platelet glycoprotein Ib alpha chain-like [Monopterus albus]